MCSGSWGHRVGHDWLTCRIQKCAVLVVSAVGPGTCQQDCALRQAVPETGRGHGGARGPGLAAELWAMVQWLCCVFSVRGWVQVCPGGGS